MTEVVFQCQPVFLPLSMLGYDEIEVFTAFYPERAQWLEDHAAGFRVSCYRWPEALSHIVYREIGVTVCEIQVSVAADCAERFADAFSESDDHAPLSED